MATTGVVIVRGPSPSSPSSCRRRSPPWPPSPTTTAGPGSRRRATLPGDRRADVAAGVQSALRHRGRAPASTQELARQADYVARVERAAALTEDLDRPAYPGARQRREARRLLLLRVRDPLLAADLRRRARHPRGRHAEGRVRPRGCRWSASVSPTARATSTSGSTSAAGSTSTGSTAPSTACPRCW